MREASPLVQNMHLDILNKMTKAALRLWVQIASWGAFSMKLISLAFCAVVALPAVACVSTSSPVPEASAQQASNEAETPQQWCAKAVVLMGNSYVAEQAREALLETARNRGCFNAPPATSEVAMPKLDQRQKTCAGDMLVLKYGDVKEDERDRLVTEMRQNRCGR